MGRVAEERVLDPLALDSYWDDVARDPFSSLIVDLASDDLMAECATRASKKALVGGGDFGADPLRASRSFPGPDERSGQALSQFSRCLGILYMTREDLVGVEGSELVPNLLGIAVNQDQRTTFVWVGRQSGIELVAAAAVAIEANRLHGPAIFFDLVTLAAIEPLLVVGPVQGLGRMQVVIELDAGILFDVAGPCDANGRLAGILDDGESNRRVIRFEVAGIVESARRKLCREGTVAVDAKGCALVCQRNFSTSMFEMAVRASHFVEPGHCQVGGCVPTHVDMTTGAGLVRDPTKEPGMTGCAIVLDDRVTTNDGTRRPDRPQGGHGQGKRQEDDQDSPDGDPCERPSCQDATFDSEMRSLVEGRTGILVDLPELVFDSDVFATLGSLDPQGPGTDVDFVADRQAFARCWKAVDHDLLSLGGFDIEMSLAQADRGMVERGGQALETQIVVWTTPDIEGLDFDGVFESDTLPAWAQFDFSKADAH